MSMTSSTYHQSIVALYATREDAEAARRDLIAAGIPDRDITMHAAGNQTGTSTANAAQPLDTEAARAEQHRGGFMDWLFGGEYDETTTRHRAAYEESINQRNQVMLAVKAIDTEAEYDRIAAILDRHNPININEGEYAQRFGGYQHTWGSTTATTGATTTGAAPPTTGERLREAGRDLRQDMTAPTTTGERLRETARDVKQDLTGTADRTDRAGVTGTDEVIPVVQEEIQIGKRQVYRSKPYRIRTRVVETPVQEQVRLRDETVTVERRAASGEVPPGTEPFKERAVEVREMREEAVVNKTARVKEEVVVRKEAQERVETVRDTVRETQVEVDRAAAGEKPAITTETSTTTNTTGAPIETRGTPPRTKK